MRFLIIAAAFAAAFALAAGTASPANAVKRIGGPGNDTLVGTKAADTLIGMGGHDTLQGLAGNDWLDGGPGRSILDGGSGNDKLAAVAQGRHMLTGGLGADTFIPGLDTDNLPRVVVIKDFQPGVDHIIMAETSATFWDTDGDDRISIYDDRCANVEGDLMCADRGFTLILEGQTAFYPNR